MDDYGNVCIPIRDYKDLVERSQKLNVLRNALTEMAQYDETNDEVFFTDLYSYLPRLLRVVDPGYYKALLEKAKGERPRD